MSIDANSDAYFRSISAELASRAERIRHLIGDSHFLSDGHHKEYLLQSVLSRFLPSGYICSRGFVVRDNQLQLRSTEQDLLVVDARTHAPLFCESGLVVTFPENVRAAVSVKSTLTYAAVDDALDGLATIPELTGSVPIWRGVYGFRIDAGWAEKLSNFVKWLKTPRKGESAPRIASWQCGAMAGDGSVYVTVDQADGEQHVRAYDTQLSSALFIAELTDHLAVAATAKSAGINELLANVEFPRIE